jgi:hypothetical protein
MPDKPFRDPLTDLRARLEETRRAAEQLAGEVDEARARERASNGDEPPTGDTPPLGGADGAEGLRDEVAAMTQLVGALVELVPAELREQVYEIMRQILLLLRALIDWLVDRLPQVRGAELAVEDIPVS